MALKNEKDAPMHCGHETCRAGEDIQGEHAAMLRQWSACQQRVSQLVRDYQQQIAALQAEVLRLRAQQMVATTRRLWALERPAVELLTSSSALQTQAPSVLVRATAAAALASEHPWQTLAAAAQVICRTGCISHAHHWLDGSRCRLHGQTCEQVTAAAGSHPTLTER